MTGEQAIHWLHVLDNAAMLSPSIPQSQYDLFSEAIITAINAIKKVEDERRPVKVVANKTWNTVKCPYCGQVHGDDSYDVETFNFCPHCGQPFEWKVEV